ncbi:MAG TPA: cation transporter [Dermatophilaceae bacterium]
MTSATGRSIVLDVGGLHWAISASVVENVLSHRPGVIGVQANAVAQTASVTYDPARTCVAELSGWVRDCGYHCAGLSVPEHLCDPMAEAGAITAAEPSAHATHEEAGRSAQAVMGHGGGHGGMSMDDMVRDMRNRFLVAAVLSVPILLWSPIGREVLGFSVAAPFGLRDDVFSLLLSLPVIFYSAWIFFDGASRALRARTLDMMVLAAVGVGTGWLYSLGVTLTGGGRSSTRRPPS